MTPRCQSWALIASHVAVSWGRKPVFLVGFAVLPFRGLHYSLGGDPYSLVGVQLLDGIGAGIFGVVSVLIVADLTKGTGQGQRSLNRCSSKDFQHVVLVPTTTATFHDETRAVWILLQE